jgi:acyl-homoserine-lactone acylase
MRKALFGGALIIIVVLVAFFLLQPEEVDLTPYKELGTKYDVRILRDTWGVPHIFGKRDADVAFGLAYAHAEDDFKTLQGILFAIRGRLATILGKRGAPNDYMVHLLRLWDVVDQKYESDLQPQTRALCEAYADGMNYYAALHPDEVNPELIPVRGKDIVAGFVHKVPLFFGLDKTLKEIFESDAEPSAATKKAGLLSHEFSFPASQTFSVSPRRSTDGNTYLAVNSHQPWQGPVTWYEIHLHSDEGWDTVGGTFPGSPLVLHGHNRYLGWAHTVNRPDLIDVYVLDINPDNPNQYRFDGKWRELEVRIAPITVKLLGPIRWTFEREVLWSVYGPVIRRPHATYAIRYVGYGNIQQVEQWYRMNKARNFSEWQSAMRMLAVPCFHCGYADREGNIYYLYNALLPLRPEGYDWSGYLPGNSSKTLWSRYLPFDRLPQVKNPPSGFVQNCNSSPYRTTLGKGNPRPEDYPSAFGIETRMTNRALRALELFGTDTEITEDEFYRYKYDMSYSVDSKMAQFLERIFKVRLPADPLLQEALDILKKWDLRTNPENTGAALAVMSFRIFLKQDVEDVSDEEIIESFTNAARLLKEEHGRIDVPWKQVHRLIRGTVDLGLGGGPDVLHAVEKHDLLEGGRLKGNQGDSYVLLVTWDRNGRVRSRSIHQFGSATLDERSPHFADQAQLFVQRKLKPVWMDETEIRAHLEKEYRPGEE